MKRLLPFIALAVVMSACVKPEEQNDIKFSVLGDSFSAFEGTVDPDSNDVYNYERIGVTSAEQMWWHKVATAKEWTLEKNNSFSGSLMCNYWGFNAGPYYKPHSFINRMDNLGNPDVIFIQGGTTMFIMVHIGASLSIATGLKEILNTTGRGWLICSTMCSSSILKPKSIT